MPQVPLYTAITFAPVQGFIEKSRKLRDLYGSSFILSYLANALCDAAQNHARSTGQAIDTPYRGYPVISPALIDVTQGTPNLILIAGDFPKAAAQAAFNQAWSAIAKTCRTAIETRIKGDYRYWKRNWALWERHAWEFFWATGASINTAKANLFQLKQRRDWTGINWIGESSTLSGADTIAYPEMGEKISAKHRNVSEIDQKIKQFYQQLSQCWKSVIDEREQLSIPELIKRFVTIEDITKTLPDIETPKSFQKLNRWKDDHDVDRQAAKRWTGWFLGDGDRVSDYLRNRSEVELHQFSEQMRRWGNELEHCLRLNLEGRIIYAGGDDFLGVFYRNPPDAELTPIECLRWFYRFRTEIWTAPVSVSVGFVWAAPNVPQRDVLQHCREAEHSAKNKGRDRIALRILFNGGSCLEWVCPWQWLEPLLEGYRDRAGETNWTHLYNDVAALESRHAFGGNQTDVAFALLDVYFPKNTVVEKLRSPIVQRDVLGTTDPTQINTWISNLAKVGFHLCQAPTPLQASVPKRIPSLASSI